MSDWNDETWVPRGEIARLGDRIGPHDRAVDKPFTPTLWSKTSVNHQMIILIIRPIEAFLILSTEQC